MSPLEFSQCVLNILFLYYTINNILFVHNYICVASEIHRSNLIARFNFFCINITLSCNVNYLINIYLRFHSLYIYIYTCYTFYDRQRYGKIRNECSLKTLQYYVLYAINYLINIYHEIRFRITSTRKWAFVNECRSNDYYCNYTIVIFIKLTLYFFTLFVHNW